MVVVEEQHYRNAVVTVRNAVGSDGSGGGRTLYKCDGGGGVFGGRTTLKKCGGSGCSGGETTL